MPADIRVTITRGMETFGPYNNTSVDILRKGDVVTCECPHIDQTSYFWVLSYKPLSSNGTVSSATLSSETARVTTFTADFDGAYLIQLTVNEGVAGEDTQFIRVRGITKFAGMKLPAAGERYNQDGPVPVDAAQDGWTNFLNTNLQRLTALTRRGATSGRVLYVDANRPKGYKGIGNESDTDNLPNNPDTSVKFPGTDQTSGTTDTQTGISIATNGIGDFGTIQAAINYATTRMDPVPSLTNPVWVVIRPGLYKEDLTLAPFIHLTSDVFIDSGQTVFELAVLTGTMTIARPHSVIIQSATGVGHTFPAPDMPPWDGEWPLPPEVRAFFENFPALALHGVSLENWTPRATMYPTLKMTGTGYLYLNGCTVAQAGSTVTQPAGECLWLQNPNHGTNPNQSNMILCYSDDCAYGRSPEDVEHVSEEHAAAVSMDSRGILYMRHGNSFSGGFAGIYVPEEAAASGDGDPRASRTEVVCGPLGSTTINYDIFFRGMPAGLAFYGAAITGDISVKSDTVPTTVPFSTHIAIMDSLIDGRLIINDEKRTPGRDTAVSLDKVSNDYISDFIVMESAPTRVAVVSAATGMTISSQYITSFIPPELGPSGTTTLPSLQQLPMLGATPIPLNTFQNFLDILLQIAVPDAPPTNHADPDYDANRRYTPTLDSMYDGIHHLDIHPVRGEGLGRRIYVSQRGGITDLPVQIAPADPTDTDRHLLRIGCDTYGPPGVGAVNRYVDLGCEVHGTLKVWGSIDSTGGSSARGTQFAEVVPLSSMMGNQWPGTPGLGFELADGAGCGRFPITADTLIYGVKDTRSIGSNPSLFMPQSRGVIGPDQLPREGQVVVIKDLLGTAGSFPITLNTTRDSTFGGVTNVQFEYGGPTSYTISVASQSLMFVYHVIGTTGYWFLI